MDPVSIIATAGTLIKTCVTIAQTVDETVSSYKDAPRVLSSIAVECNVFTQSLQQFHIVVQRRGFGLNATQNALGDGISGALRDIEQTLTTLQKEVWSIGGGKYSLGLRGKVKVMWSKERLNELLQEIRGKQTSLGCLTNLLSK
jgi:hypothetical protein